MTTIIPLNTGTKQPKGLYSLSFVELWERFGFYIVQSLLVLFLTKVYHQTDTQAYDLFSAFSVLIYATPVIGGYLADRLLGYRRSIILGGMLFTLGYFGLAFSGAERQFFFPSLALLICGNGLFKSCISTLVGTLYRDNDPRRDGGFTIFYMGINVGSLLGPLLGTWAATAYGWGYGFAVAGVGMILCLIIATFGFKILSERGLPPNSEKLLKRSYFGLSLQNLVCGGILLVVVLISSLLHYSRWVNHIFNFFSLATAAVVVILTFRYKAEQRNKMLVLIVLTVFSVMFWAFYNQTFTSLTLFTEQVVNRHIFNWVIPTAMFQSVNPFFIIVLSPVLSLIWIRLSGTRWELSTPGKFAFAMILMGAGFLVLPLGVHYAGAGGLVAMTWLNLNYFLQTLGELCLSPIGLSMIIALAPSGIRGMMMGVWFLSTAAAYAVGDYIADLTSIPANVTDPIAIGKIYGHVYTQLGIASLVVAVILIILTPWLKRMMGDQARVN